MTEDRRTDARVGHPPASRTGGSRDHLDGSFVDKIGSVELVVVVQPHDALANSFTQNIKGGKKGRNWEVL